MKPTQDPSTVPGANRTGLALRPELRDEMIAGTAEFGPITDGGPQLMAQIRVVYAEESEPAGTMPPMPEAEAARLPLLDKLGARLQFERTGTRLYDALISKLDAYGPFEGGPTRQDLLQIREQELAHAILVDQLITMLGGDPTVITPCANLQATASKGICDVLVDPRTSLIECLEAIMVAELADYESWSVLARTAELMGDSAITTRIATAQQTELEHLTKVRTWLARADGVRLATAAGEART